MLLFPHFWLRVSDVRKEFNDMPNEALHLPLFRWRSIAAGERQR
jgi:hypothetical protein